MRINGEMLFCINGWMDFLCLALTGCLGKRRLRPARMLAAAAMGGAYGVMAYARGPWIRGIPALLAVALLMTLIAFGKSGLRLWPVTAASGLFFAGASGFLMEKGVSPQAVMLLCGGIMAALAAVMRAMAPRGRGEFRLRLTLAGRAVTLPAFRDSGNLLRDGITGLPVIVAPAGLLRPLLPPGLQCSDLSTLPRGWRLLPVQTAAGQKCLMCFQPDKAWLTQGKVLRPIRAAVAISDSMGSRALLPEAVFMQEEGDNHAGL